MAVDDLGIELGDLDALSGTAADDDVTRIAPAGEATQQLPSSGDTMDFDLSELSPEVTLAGEIDETQRVDMDVGGAMFEAEASESVTEQVSLDELPEMSDLEPVTMSEVGTKLDLARAYVDMGDPDGARSILEEVLKEGSASQKQEAQRLLDSLPGA
jgi:pilus assembly protein FimV